MDPQAVTGPLYIVDGEVQDVPAIPGVLAQSAPSTAVRGRDRDALFAHLSLTGPFESNAALLEDLLDVLSRSYFQSSGSVTAALRKAILEVNQHLLRRNLAAGENLAGAINCAVQRGQELYLAQAGEALAVLGHPYGVERQPPTTPEHLTPLGPTAGLDIRLYHHWIEPGNTLLLADPRLAHLPAATLRPALVDADVESGLEALTGLVGPGTARLLLVEFAEEAPVDLPDQVTAPAPSPSAERLSLPTTAPVRERAAAPAAAARETARSAMQSATNRARDTLDGRDVEGSARRGAAQAARGLSQASTGLAAVLMRLRPPPPDPDEPPTNVALAGMIAVIIPIFVAIVFAGVYTQRGQLNLLVELRSAMSLNLGLAEQAVDEATALNHFNEVIRLAATAEAIRPEDAEVGRLRLAANQGLDRLNDVTRLSAERLFVYPEGTEIGSIALGSDLNGDIYTLDTANNLVYRHETDDTFLNLIAPEPQIIFRGGQAIGNQVVDRAVDILWRPRGSAVTRDGLAMLDDRGLLATYYPNFDETEAAPLGFASEWWRGPVAVTSFNERLYVVDPAADTIWRYFPEGDGFIVDEARRAIEFDAGVTLSNAVDATIDSVDGSVVVVFSDGRLRRYTNGRPQWTESELANNGLTLPLVSPAAVRFSGDGPSSSLFVFDPGSGRIVQLSRRGNFLAQFRVTDELGRELLSGAYDFAVAEAPLRLFFAVDNILYVATQN